MLEAVFTKILQMSLMGCYSIGLVLAVRLLLMRCGKVYAYYLWVLVFVCLCLPVSLPGNYSLIPEQVAAFSRLDPAGQEATMTDPKDLQEPELILEPHSLPVLTAPLSDQQQYGWEEADVSADTHLYGKESGSDSILTGKESVHNGNLPEDGSERDRILSEDGSKPNGILSGKGSEPDGILAGGGSGPDKILAGDGSGFDRTPVREESESDKIPVGTDISGQQIRRNVSMADWKGAAQIWLLGVVVLTIGILFSIFRMSFRCSGYRRLGRKQEAHIVEADGLQSPFLWGFFRPVIYLPSGMEGQEREYILAHEMVHRNRKDHLVRVFILAVTVLHWFNPLVWLAYSLCSRDMEISCDEAVLDRSEKNIRKAYAESLLKYAARQNRYIISPLGFGEPSVRSRIKNVLRHKKKSAWISAVAGLCVVGIATGLLHYPAGDKAAVRNEIPDSGITEAEPLPEGEELPVDADEGLVVNNGGEVICAAGEYYYLDGVPLYSDGESLYHSAADDDGSWHIYRRAVDGSSLKQILEGRIVDSTEYGQVLFCMFPTDGAGTECLGWYDTRTEETGRFSHDDVSYLGMYAGYLYTSRQESDGLHVDRVRTIDLTEADDLMKEGIPAREILTFYADEGRNRLIFAAGESGASAESSRILCYSYEFGSGRLISKELTSLPYFAVMDGYVYFQRYRSREDLTMELFRTDYEFSGEEQIGEGLTLLGTEDETHTLLAEKKVEHPDFASVSSLVRILPEEKKEQMLLDMEVMLPAVGGEDHTVYVDCVYLDWDFQKGDGMAYSELNRLDERIYVTVSHLSRAAGDTSVEQVHLTVNSEGGIGIWEPEKLIPGWKDDSWYTEFMVGYPVEVEAAGWDPEHAIDVREHFRELPRDPKASERMRTYHLNETEYWTLYGKGDYKSMLLERNGRCTQINYPYMSSHQNCPELMEADLDRDGITELAIRFNIKHGTGCSIDTLLLADFQNNGIWVYQFMDEDFAEQLMAHLTSEQTEHGLQAYIDGEPAGEAVEDEKDRRTFQSVSVGQLVDFFFDETEGKIRIQADLEFWDDDHPEMAWYNGCSITADVIWTGDHFTLRNISCLEPENEKETSAMGTE